MNFFYIEGIHYAGSCFEFVQGYTSISTLAFRAICGAQLLPKVRFNDPARFLCIGSVQ